MQADLEPLDLEELVSHPDPLVQRLAKSNLFWMTRAGYKQRSVTANRYYYGIVLPFLANETGNSANAMHAYCKRYFLPPAAESTADLTTLEFWQYNEQIAAFFAGHGICIPLPRQIMLKKAPGSTTRNERKRSNG